MSVTQRQTAQRFQNGFLKVSISWLLQAKPPSQDRSQSTVCRAWVPLPTHYYCLFPHSHKSLSCVGLFPFTDDCPKLSHWQVLQAKHQRCLQLLRTGARSPYSSLEITSCNTPQVPVFQADLILPHTKPFWSLRVTSQLWSLCKASQGCSWFMFIYHFMRLSLP